MENYPRVIQLYFRIDEYDRTPGTGQIETVDRWESGEERRNLYPETGTTGSRKRGRQRGGPFTGTADRGRKVAPFKFFIEGLLTKLEEAYLST